MHPFSAVFFRSFSIADDKGHYNHNLTKKISTCAVAIQRPACMPFMAMHAGLWISNPLPNEQNADALADALARKRGFCECGKWVGCSLEHPTAQVE